jgi:hypothetical protein
MHVYGNCMYAKLAGFIRLHVAKIIQRLHVTTLYENCMLCGMHVFEVFNGVARYEHTLKKIWANFFEGIRNACRNIIHILR